MSEHELVLNDATCSYCGSQAECDCWINNLEEYVEPRNNPDDDRDDYLPLPGSTVVENKADSSPDFMRRTFDHEEQERRTNEENLRLLGLGNNELLVPPPVTDILVHERRAELAERQVHNRHPQTSSKGHSADGLTYPML